jgi:hypothetical protein
MRGKVSLLKIVNKKGELLNQMIIQIILVVLVFAVFLMVTADKVNARGVRQQVVERELALLIDSAVPGMSFAVWKANMNGIINDVQIRDGRVFVALEGLNALKGYGFFSRYYVNVVEEDDKFVVSVDE